MTSQTTSILRSDEFSCPSCVTRIEKALNVLPGVSSAKVHFNTGRIEVEHDAGAAPVETLVQTIRASGYEVRPAAF